MLRRCGGRQVMFLMRLSLVIKIFSLGRAKQNSDSSMKKLIFIIPFLMLVFLSWENKGAKTLDKIKKQDFDSAFFCKNASVLLKGIDNNKHEQVWSNKKLTSEMCKEG